MSNLFKKIKSIETVSEAKASDLDTGLGLPILDETSESPTLRKSSDPDTQNEVFETNEDTEADELLDLHNLPLPGFLKGSSFDVDTSESVKPNSTAHTPAPKITPSVYIPKPSVPDPKETHYASKSYSSETFSKYEGPTAPAYEDAPRGLTFFKTGVLLTMFFWVITAAAIAYGYFDLGLNWQTVTPLNMAGLALLVLAPALLIGVSAYAIAQLSAISRKAQNLERAATALMHPNAHVTEKAAALSDAIKVQIDRVDSRMEQALNRMAQMEMAADTHAQALDHLITKAEASSKSMSNRFQSDHAEITDTTEKLQDKITELSQMVSNQATTLAKIIQLSDRKVNDARISAEGAAAKMNTASELVRTNTVEATSALTAGHAEIEKLGEMIIERSQELDAVYRNHAKDLTIMIEQLRDEQENLGVSLEARLEKMRDVARSAKNSADSLTQASDSGRATIQSLSEASRITEHALRTRFTEMEKMVEYSNSRAENINQTATRRVQNSLALTRTEISRIESDMQSLQDRMNQQLEASMVPIQTPSRIPSPVVSEEQNPLNVEPADEGYFAPESKSSRSRLRFHLLPEDAKFADPAQQGFDSDESNFTSNSESMTNMDEPDALEYFEELTIPIASDEDLGPAGERFDTQAPEPAVDELYPSPFETEPDVEGEAFIRPISSMDRMDIRTSEKSTKSIWPWRRPAPVSEFYHEPLVAPEAETETVSPTSLERQIVATLTGMGLSPGAIVDDGCIIEAANTRKAKGAKGMSLAVSYRLKEPVEHLRGALDLNPELRSDSRLFTSQFQHRLNSVSNDREGIRTGLESEAGRAFLLCDAALNG